MRVLPILFNTEMVRVILGDKKTCTRRVVKFLPGENPQWTGYVKDGLMLYNGRNEPCIRKAPYQPGDILYVRESFVQAASHIFWYKADDKEFLSKCKSWKPSIHMPKDAARIWLKVTDVRVERLQEMDWKDALEEGIDPRLCVKLSHSLAKFRKIWDSTIKKSDMEQYGWDANPWVWVIEFERCEKPPECILKGYDKAPNDGEK